MEDSRHVPVMLDEVLAALEPRPGQVFVDCTVGLGGHSAEILRRILPGGRLIGLDFDPASLESACQKLTPLKGAKGHFQLVHNNFAALNTVLANAGIEKIHGILADLGVSSPQIDDPARGFSYRQNGPLDMRMDPSRGQTAAALINRLPEHELAAAFLDYGDEEDAPAIARLIVQRRAVKPIETTRELAAVVCQARRFTMQRAAGAKLHPAARTFQALRILVNRELANLDRLLAVAPDLLAPAGTIAILSFHSGEDRRVKKAFIAGKRSGLYAAINNELTRADTPELHANPRSRSAKLRWARRA
jgi:16S rRNA (cytosine1402-N4)-methyltransferase